MVRRNAVRRSRKYQHFLETLEVRTLLSVSPTEFAAIKEMYPALNLGDYGDYNIIEVGGATSDGESSFDFSEAGLRGAITQAGITTENDLIVVRTSTDLNTILLSGSELVINFDADTYGSVTIVSLGDDGSEPVPLTIDAQQNSRVLGITNYSSIVSLAGLTITNGSDSSGGGIASYAVSLTITNSTITGNAATSYTGGGMYLGSGSVTVTNSTITGNTAKQYGGGIYGNACSLTVENSTISGNTADNDGGGIYQYNGSLTVTNSTLITGNTANSYGGGIYQFYGTVTVDNSTISENTADNNGGGIYQNNGSLTVTNSTLITGNTASNGGGGIYNDYGLLTVTNATISLNTANNSGGGIYNNAGDVTLTSVTISENIASNEGGGIYNRFSAYNGGLTVTNSTITENTANYGGGILHYASNSGNVATITNSFIMGNTANYRGGGISNRGMLTVEGSVISGNEASGTAGGIENLGSLTLTHSTITENTAAGSGGGIYTGSSGGEQLTVTHSIISGNTANNGGSSGGGIYIASNSGAVTVTNSLIVRNTANYDGGGIYNSCSDTYGSVTVENSTIADNAAGNKGGGIYNRYGTPTVVNTIIVENTMDDIYSDGGTINGYYNLTPYFAGWSGGSSNGQYTPSWPLFVDAAAGNYRLDPNAWQAINQGSNARVPIGLTTDLDGNARISNGTVDVGAYEYQTTTPGDGGGDDIDWKEFSMTGTKAKVSFDVKAGDIYTVVVETTTAAGKTTYAFKTYTAKKDQTIIYNVSGKDGNTYVVSLYEGKVTKKDFGEAGDATLSTTFSLPVTPKLKKGTISDDQVSFTIANWAAVKDFALTVTYGEEIAVLSAGGATSDGNVSIDANGKITIIGLSESTAYTFFVSSSSGSFEGVADGEPLISKAAMLKLKTDKMAYMQVSNVAVTDRTATTLTVAWDAATGKDGSGSATGYTITVTNVATGKVAKTVKVSKGVLEGLVKGLKADTLYAVTVKANGDKAYSDGLISDPVEERTAIPL